MSIALSGDHCWTNGVVYFKDDVRQGVYADMLNSLYGDNFVPVIDMFAANGNAYSMPILHHIDMPPLAYADITMRILTDGPHQIRYARSSDHWSLALSRHLYPFYLDPRMHPLMVELLQGLRDHIMYDDTSVIHGDPTYSNVMEDDRNAVVLIDPLPPKVYIWPTPAYDHAKIWQSLYGWDFPEDKIDPYMWQEARRIVPHRPHVIAHVLARILPYLKTTRDRQRWDAVVQRFLGDI